MMNVTMIELLHKRANRSKRDRLLDDVEPGLSPLLEATGTH